MPMIKLYVETLSENNTIGITQKASTIQYNLKQLNPQIQDDFNNALIQKENAAYQLGYVGRYIYYLAISLDNKSYKMGFFDLQKDKAKALYVATQFDNHDTQVEFIAIFEKHLNYYSPHYRDALLIQGSPPKY